MAVVLLFRFAVAIGASYRIAKAAGPHYGQPNPFTPPQWLWDKIKSELFSDAEVESDLNALSGRVWSVATYTGTFTLRKLQVRWGRDSGDTSGTDDAVTTHHFVKLDGSGPTDDWDAPDFEAAETAFGAFWATSGVKNNFHASVSLKQYRWYRTGPGLVPPLPPVRVVDVDEPGTAASSPVLLPPQIAVSVTEKVSDPKSWGRFYMPGPIAAALIPDQGRLNTAIQGAWSDALDVMYEQFVADGIPAVVYSPAKPERLNKALQTLPATEARALTVDQIQVDDVLDVIRSRRWSGALLRIQRDIG